MFLPQKRREGRRERGSSSNVEKHMSAKYCSTPAHSPEQWCPSHCSSRGRQLLSTSTSHQHLLCLHHFLFPVFPFYCLTPFLVHTHTLTENSTVLSLSNMMDHHRALWGSLTVLFSSTFIYKYVYVPLKYLWNRHRMLLEQKIVYVCFNYAQMKPGLKSFVIHWFFNCLFQPYVASLSISRLSPFFFAAPLLLFSWPPGSQCF